MHLGLIASKYSVFDLTLNRSCGKSNHRRQTKFGYMVDMNFLSNENTY